MGTGGNKTSRGSDAVAAGLATSPQRLRELNAALSALAKEIELSTAAVPAGAGKRPVPEHAFNRVVTIVESIQVESGIASRARLVAPPRLVEPRFEIATSAGDKAPKVVDLGGNAQLRMANRALALGVPGVVEVRLDDAGSVSVSTPVGGVTVDEGGIAVDAGSAGKATVGKDGASVEAGGGRVTLGPGGASVSVPGVGTVGVGKDGTITVGPAAGGGLPSPTTPSGIPIPVPHFAVQTIEIPIPVPRFVTERFDVPLPYPRLEALQWPDLAGWLKQSLDEASSLLRKDPLLDALAQAMQIWTPAARLQKIRIDASLAFGGPGCLSGPDLRPLIAAHAAVAGASGDERALAEAVAAGLDEAFRRWMTQVTVPGLPWYPAFAAYPGPVAPPMPNTPTPLLACVSSQLDAITVPGRLEEAIQQHLPSPSSANARTRLRILSGQVAAFFGQWLAHKMVMSVIGQGTVPGFALPHVPAGAVVNGRAEGLPGCVV